MKISYRGTNYHGWQFQKNALTVQQIFQESLEKVLRKQVNVTGSGRTDTGVHATGQVVHLDTDMPLNRPEWLFRINRVLPPDIAVHSIRKVIPGAHARFDAMERSYFYRIRRNKDPFSIGGYYHFAREVDIGRMNRACEMMRGEEDFESFSRVKTDVEHFLCTIREARWENHNDELTFYVSANRFLRGMVRALAGTLLDIGEGRKDLKEFLAIIHSKDRRKAGRSVPAEGLYLSEVKYPENIYLT